MTSLDLAGLRRDYESTPFDVADADPDPFVQFERWFADVALASEIEPNAVVLATCDNAGRPSARHVLVKGVDRAGFRFFTNYESRKALELVANPQACLVFAWAPLHRQVVVEGGVAKLAGSVSDKYFASRPRTSQLGAWASAQSRVLASRAELDEAYQVAVERWGDGPIERPAHWGGFVVVPDRIEFWQGRPSRLHDRISYARTLDGTWNRSRLAP